MLEAALLIAQSNVEVNSHFGGGLLFGIICAVIAPGRGRSGVAWFFLGLIFSCIALIILLLLPNLSDEGEKELAAKRELHRLREQVKKERQVADQRHDAHRSRLDVHDRALGMDTSETEQQHLTEEPAPPRPLPPPAPGPGEPESMWLLSRDQEQFGPYPSSEVRKFVVDGRADRDTLVWRDGMAEWMPLGDVPELT